MKNKLIKLPGCIILQLLVISSFPQDTNNLHSESGQVSRPWFWITIAIISLLFLIFVIAKSNRAKKEIVKDERKAERVVENTKPDEE